MAKKTAKRLAEGKTMTYKDIKSRKLADAIRVGQMDDKQAQWAAAYTLFMHLEREGIACHGPDSGSNTSFVHRKHWCPKLRWSPPNSDDAFADLAYRYLATYGPAEPRDLAFWYGTSVTEGKRWCRLLPGL